jgi:hypothetical protein
VLRQRGAGRDHSASTLAQAYREVLARVPVIGDQLRLADPVSILFLAQPEVDQHRGWDAANPEGQSDEIELSFAPKGLVPNQFRP